MEVGSLSREPGLGVGPEGRERAEVAWEGWRRWWLGKGREACWHPPAGIFHLAYLGLPVHR